MLKAFYKQSYHYYSNNKLKTLTSVALILTLIYGVLLRLFALDSVIINEWVTRDYDRAFSLLSGDYIPLAGPDLTNGGRLPGPFMYFFLILPLLLRPSYEAIFNFNFLLNITSLFAVFFISKRYFGFYFAIVATALTAADLSHIGAVHFPMNPAFIISFLTLFVGVLLEFSIKRKEKYFPLLVIIISLGIQFHYQIATYILIPIVIAIVFKIKISKKSILLSLIIATFCFLPYSIYKLKTFSFGQNSHHDVYTFILKESFFVNLIKSIPVQNTIERLYFLPPVQMAIAKVVNLHPTYFGSSYLIKPFIIKGYDPEKIKYFSRIGFSLAFYFSILFIGIQSFRHGKERYIKEISLLILFFVPAYIYELTRPFIYHYWYNYIFIIPKIYIITYSIILIYNSVRHRLLKNGVIIFLIIFFINHFLHTSQITSVAFNYFKGSLNNINNTTSNLTTSYKHSKFLLNTVMRELNLNPKEYYDRVYFLDFNPSSLKRIQLASSNTINISSRLNSPYLDKCFFILDPQTFSSINFNNNDKLHDIGMPPKYRIFKAFLDDQTINIQGVREISFTKYGFKKLFSAYLYVPKFKQPCYTNSHNPYVVSKNTRNLIQEAKALSPSTKKSKPNFTQISLDEKYNFKSELSFLEGKYIILNPVNNTPFRLTVLIQKINNFYSVRGTVDSFFYFNNGYSNFNFLDILITSDKENNHLIKSKDHTVDKFKANILSKKSLLTSNGLNSGILYGLQNYNQNWYREFLWEPKVELTKDNFYIDVKWGMYTDGIIKNHSIRLRNQSGQNKE
jgi:hypothetical protein